VKEHEIDCVIVNAENAAGGSGLTPQIYEKLLKYGVHLITMGDHIYRKKDIVPTLQNSNCIVKPINMSSQAAGREWACYTTARGAQVAVVSVLGRMYMTTLADNPFHAIDKVLAKIPPDIKIIVVDMHAEVSSEKIAMGWHLDGKVTAVIGTHTHVQTADDQILPGGTAYLTDVGMTGPHDGIIGVEKAAVIDKFLRGMPVRMETASGNPRLNGILIAADESTGKAMSIQRLSLSAKELEHELAV